MKNFRLLLLISILTALLVACGGADETPDPTEELAAVSTNTPEPVEPSPTPEPAEPTITVEPTETTEPTVEPTEVVPTATPEEIAMAEFEGDECLTCHADKERLIETAALVEEAPSESSGVG